MENNPQLEGGLKLHRDCSFGEVSILALSSPSLENPFEILDGTPLAIDTLITGVAVYSAPDKCKGGPRNKAERQSLALNTAQVANLIAALRHANKIGLPLNRLITIHWQAAGIPLESMAKATGRFVDLLSKALGRRARKTAWLWVHENSGFGGGHCHLLAHVPSELVSFVSGLQKGWLRRITGKPYRARVLNSKPIGGRLGLEVGNPALLSTNQEAALAYLLKGAGPEAASNFCLERLQPGGLVLGKRCGVSQRLSKSAREAWLKLEEK